MFISAPGGLRPQSVGADPTFNFVTNENDRHSEKTELQTSKRKEIDRLAAIPLSLCPFPPSRPRDLVIPHRNRLLIRLAPSFPIHPLAIKPFPPPNVGLRWALHIYKKKKLPLPWHAFLFFAPILSSTTPLLLHTFNGTHHVDQG